MQSQCVGADSSKAVLSSQEFKGSECIASSPSAWVMGCNRPQTAEKTVATSAKVTQEQLVEELGEAVCRDLAGSIFLCASEVAFQFLNLPEVHRILCTIQSDGEGVTGLW